MLLPPIHGATLVVDTGPLLIHAFSLFHQGRYLPEVAADTPRTDIHLVGEMLSRLFAGREIVTTPQVLVELQHVAQTRARLDDKGLKDFLKISAELLTKLTEHHVPKDDLVMLKAAQDAWKFCFADTSVILVSRNLDAPLLTNDNSLKRFCRPLGIDVRHIYYDLFLSQSF